MLQGNLVHGIRAEPRLGGREKARELLGWAIVLLLLGVVLACQSGHALADGQIPGTDQSDKLEAAGTALRLIDTALFKWGARLLAGVCIMSGAWSLKEQRFGVAIICIIGALLLGSAPTWVKNIFSIAGSDSVFGMTTEPGAEGESVDDAFTSGGVICA